MDREMRIRNYSERTIKSYICSVGQVARYYNLPPSQITIDQFKAHLHHLINNKNCSVSRINQDISAWKILQQDILGRTWEAVKVKRPRREKKLPVVLSMSEARAMINAPVNTKHRILLTLAYATGIRRNELLNITLKDIDRKRGVIKIAGKGKKQREVPLSSNLLNLLEEYYRKYRPSEFLFEGHVPGKAYSAGSVAKIVKRAALKTDIKKNVSPHVLRHSYATHMLEKGVNLKRLQLLLGHSSMKTTSVYLHLADLDKAELPDLSTDND
jgi:site-specific recombinase XerD